MKKYLLKRILFSIFAIFVVVGTVMVLVYSLIDRELIFVNDQVLLKKKYNEAEIYKLSKYKDYGYITYESYTSELNAKYKEQYGEGYQETQGYKDALEALYDQNNYLTNTDVAEFVTKYKKQNYEILYMKPVVNSTGSVLSSPYLFAKKDINVFVRMFKYFGNMFKFETINDVQDERLTDRYIRWEWDARSNMPALVGSGTTHKYLIYFDDKFPFIHQNIFHLNLGKSYTTFRDVDLIDVFGLPSDEAMFSEQEYPNDLGTGITHETSYDFHTMTYTYGELSDIDLQMYPDRYTSANQNHKGLSRMANSFVIGIISTILTYLLGLPLGIWIALKKDKLPDKIANLYIVFIIAVPSLAYIFMFASIGMSLFKLPYQYATADPKILAYILPTVSLTLPAMGGLMKWMRRYMIDQMNSDYVKFARSQGLSEGEIFSKHIAPNAMIFIVHNIPIDILGAMTGAIITERVYGVPGVGRLLTNAINRHDNAIIVAMTLFYTTITITALLLGDLLLAKYDPRISFTEGGN